MNIKRLTLINIIICFCFLSVASLSEMALADEPLNRIKDETLSYFKPLRGRVTSVEGDVIISDLGEVSGIRKGMRLNILKEGMPLLHPVTKEQIGKAETLSGRAEVIETTPEGSRLKIISGEAKEGYLLRLSERKVRALFYQDRSVPWEVGEALYQRLKESGRFDLVDSTFLKSYDENALLEEARKKNASIIIAVTTQQVGKQTILKERIIWTEDGANMMQTEANIDASLMKEAEFKDLLSIGLGSKEALLYFDLPYTGRLITTGNFDGRDKNELVISNGKVLRIYTPGISLLEVYEIDVPVAREHLWLDKIDINSDGKDEIVLTTLGDDEVLSYVYEKGDGGFKVLWKDKAFLRVVEGRLIAQSYTREEGYTGPVYSIDYRDGRFIKGENLKLPSGINIYDFAYITEGGSRYILSYDEKGYLSLYDVNGLRLWMSKDDSGGFMNTFKRAAPTIMVDRGDWSVKDKLFSFGNKTTFIKRIPLADMARTLGFKRSEIRVLWWTGMSMEEMVIISDISGGVMDYAVSGDRIYVLSKPLFGIKAKNILKGENPLGSMLYVYSLKGF